MNLIKYINVGGRLKSTANSENPANDHVVAGANAIYDDQKALLQSAINRYLYEAINSICEQLNIDIPTYQDDPNDHPNSGGGNDNPGNTPIGENLQEILDGLNQDLEGLDDRVTQVENTLIDLVPGNQENPDNPDNPGNPSTPDNPTNNQEEIIEENTLVEVTPLGKLRSSGKKTTDFVQTTQNLKALVIEKADYEALKSYDRDTLYFILEPIEGSVFATQESSRGEIDGFPLILN